MRLSTILVLAPLAIAAPSASPEKRFWSPWPVTGCSSGTCGGASNTQALADLIQTTVQGLETTVLSNTNAANTAINTIKSDVSTAVAQVGLINTSLKAVSDALKAAGATIVTATTGGGGIAANAQGFTQAQVQQIQDALQNSCNAVQAIDATLKAANALPAAVLSQLQLQIAAIQSAIPGFVTPLSNFACAVGSGSPTLSVQIIGLGNLLTTLLSAASSCGAGPINISGLAGLLNFIKIGLKLPLLG